MAARGVASVPLTPRDTPRASDDEDDTRDGRVGGRDRDGASQMAGRKRTASEMEDKLESGGTSETADEVDRQSGVEFTVVCPAPSRHGKLRKGVCVERDHPAGQAQLSVEYAVSPGKEWASLSRFRNAKCE